MRLGAVGIADLADAAVLRKLVVLPESDVLERKRSADAITLGRVVSGFANANGGWLLLGVDDDGSLVGWEPKGNAHLRDWLRDVLDNHLDPLPHFAADVFVLDGKAIGVVRVPRSAAAPHFMKATSEVFERRNGQTRRASAARVRELTLRDDRKAMQGARVRLDDRQAALDVAVALGVPLANTETDEVSGVASILRISLTEVPETFQTWVYEPTTLATTGAFVKSAASILESAGPWVSPPRVSQARPTARGHNASAHWDGRILSDVVVAWNSNGLGGVRLAGTRIDDSGVLYLFSDEVRDAWLLLPLEYLLGSLERAGVFGRGVVSKGLIPDHHGSTVALEIDIDAGATIAADAAAALWLNLERLAGSLAP
jgi:hypothetical protein